MTVGKVKDFNFSSAGKTVGLCKGGMAGKGYAKGGAVASDMKQDKQMVSAAVHKHEKALHKGEPLTKLAKGGKVTPKRGPVQTPSMERQAVMEEAVVRSPARRAVPVASREPMIAMKCGGMVGKKR
jgi:hypothetical protein